MDSPHGHGFAFVMHSVQQVGWRAYSHLDLATGFVEQKSDDSSSLTNQRIVTSCHACELTYSR